MSAYNLKSLKLPRITGTGLKLFASTLEVSLGHALLIGSLLENGGIPALRKKVFDDTPTFLPLVESEATEKSVENFSPATSTPDFPYRMMRDYQAAYKDGTLTPVTAAEKVLESIKASEEGDRPLRAFVASDREEVMKQAEASAKRHRRGETLGPLDGVPIAIKDEIDALPYPTTVGTSFLGGKPAPADATVTARLRAAGAVIVGKTNMHEIGIAPNGSNANFGATRNPFNDNRDTGGSSSGSATAVAAGLVPAALGADGGGSIRIPAALCGLVGLKPTYGRVSEKGAAPLCWSVAHLGPLAASVEDAAHIYSVIAGPDPADPNTLKQPPVTLKGWQTPNLKGLSFGIYPEWFEHAAPDIVETCYSLVEQFKSAGAKVREIVVPELDEMRVAHAITILSEMAVCMKNYATHRKEHGNSVRLSLTLGETFTALDYLRAQRVRTRALAIFADIFKKVDVILTPATALTARPIPLGGEVKGWSDLGTDTEYMRFVYPFNLTGLPAISFPAGYDQEGLPVGMQAVGRHWEEHILFRVAYNAEQSTQRRQPSRFYPIF
jgi:Asp-tRNA(Asn)/Glu-tRNA(Gln) amidotransferase A subunit family amidase